jgi:hypothetical protein
VERGVVAGDLGVQESHAPRVREEDYRKRSRAKCWLLSPSKLSLLFEFRREIEKRGLERF